MIALSSGGNELRDVSVLSKNNANWNLFYSSFIEIPDKFKVDRFFLLLVTNWKHLMRLGEIELTSGWFREDTAERFNNIFL